MLLVSCSQKSITTQPGIADLQGEVISLEQQQQKLYQSGLEAVRDFDDAKADIIFSQFIESYPNQAGAYVNLACIRYRQQRFDESMELIDRAIRLNERIPQAFNLQAQLRIRKHQFMLAEQDYLKAIELDTEYTNALYNLALLYDIYFQDIARAIPYYESYLGLLKEPDEATRDWVNQLKNTLNNG
jgi:tetratricopeptide (TPR) repeat protein